ncbi:MULTISPECIES: ABC transporter permease subunit [Helcococcus]|uniref:ABC transporter permease subunit n=1 Tax=Helcococcus bovis TaxID=3153252 RepID=A0ABW9F6J3_9FIRM
MWKQKKIIAIILFAILICIYSFLSTKYNYDYRHKQYRNEGNYSTIQSAIQNKYKDVLLSLSKAKRDEINKDTDLLWYFMFKKYDNSKNIENNKKSFDEFVKINQKMYEKYDLKLSENAKSNFEWLKFDNQKSINNESNSLIAPYKYKTINISRIFIDNSDIILGIPVFMVFILLFSGIISDENEHNTNSFLETQPINRHKLIFSKFLSILLMSFLYLVVALIVIYIIYGVKFRIPIGNFNDLYRVFDIGNATSHILARDLLFKIFLAYMIMMSFISSFIIFISTRVKSTMKTLVILFVTIILLTVFTNRYEILQNNYNPIYMMDYATILNGNYTEVPKGYEKILNISYSSGIYPYLIYLVLSIIFLLLSMINVKEKYTVKSKKDVKIKNKSILIYEIEKIIKQKEFKVVNIALLTLILSIFFMNFESNNKEIRSLISNEYGKLQESKVNGIEEKFREFQKTIDEGKDMDGSKQYYITYTKSRLDRGKFLRDIYTNQHKGFVNNNSELYYSNLILQLKDRFGMMPMSEYPRQANPYTTAPLDSDATYYESLARAQYAMENNVNPILTNYTFSAFETFKTPKIENDIKSELFPKSNASFQLLHRGYSLENLDYILLGFLIIACMGAYTYDKEYGNQIEFMYTQPISKYKYLVYKLLSIIIVSVVLILGFNAIIILIGLVAEGIGAYNYPIIQYNKLLENFVAIKENQRDYFSIIPLWLYILKNIFMLILQVGFISSISIFLSNIFKKKLNVIIFTFIILVAGVILSNYITEMYKAFSPFNSLSAHVISDGSIIINKIKNGSYLFSSISLILGLIIFNLFNLLIIKKNR